MDEFGTRDTAEVAAAALTVVLITFLLTPSAILFPVLGVVTIIGGIVLIACSYSIYGAASIAIGGSMLVFGLRLRARNRREFEEAAEETAVSISRRVEEAKAPRDDVT